MISRDFLANKRRELERSSRRSILAIDSSTQLASVALLSDGQTVFSEECFRQKSHSEWINGAIARAIASTSLGWEGVDLIAVTHGPGSFTGVRVATNVAKSIGFSQEKPIVSYSSLEVLAHQAEVLTETELVLPVINAFKNMVFVALFQNLGHGMVHCLKADQAVDIGQLSDWLEVKNQPLESSQRFQVLGDGFSAYQNFLNPQTKAQWLRSQQPKDHPTAATLATLALKNWEQFRLMHWRELVPTYLRASAAEENKVHKS